jgi:predicted MFS family arabinose efflux permease
MGRPREQSDREHRIVEEVIVDAFGKPLVISMATLACSAGALAAALSPTLDARTWSRVVMGAGAAGIIPLTMAWIGDQVPYLQRQEVLARLLGSTVLGMMAGSWAGGVLADTVGWRAGFFAMALLFAVIGGALRIGRVGAEQAAAGSPRHGYLAQIASVLASSWSRRLLAVSFVEGALVFGAMAFVPSYLHDRFALPLAEAGGVLALFGLGGLLYSRVAGRMLRRLGVRRCA